MWLRRGGGREEVALPPGADPSHVAVAGALGVAPVPEGAMIVFSVVDGIEGRADLVGPVRRLQRLGPVDLSGRGRRGDRPGRGWHRRARVLAGGVRTGSSPRAGRAVRARRGGPGSAWRSSPGDGLREGVRVVVVGFDGREVFRGPPAVDVGSVVIDGGVVGWSTPSCRFVGWSSRYTIPLGPCLRTEVAIARVAGGTRVACINSATRRCHVRARGRTLFVPRRGARVVPAEARCGWSTRWPERVVKP